MHSLRLKQVFVRFVSHEIRSPLHVVLAGLELLRADMSAAGSQTNLLNLELIEDMQSAGETAVNILNDLLQYENMDAGTLNLEQSWKPLTNLLQGKLKWVSILAAKKNVNLSITDSTTASEFGVDTSNDLSSPNYNAEGLNLQDGGGLPVSDTKHSSQPTPLLYVDTFRIDQVIRNLITNAMKFTPPGGNVDIRISRVDTKLETTKDKILAGKHQVGMVNVGYDAAGSQTNLLNLELIEDMQSAGETAINILNDLLQYENMDAGTLKLEQSWKPLKNLLQGKLKWVSILAAKKHVNLTVTDSTTASEFGVEANNDSSSPYSNAPAAEEGPSSLQEDGPAPDTNQPTPVLYVDTFRIDQVIRNLITNAMKFTPPGGSVDIRISRVATKPETTSGEHQAGMVNVGSLRVEVADSGAGIATKDQNAVFGEFIQFNRNEQQQGGGSGLGLWISRRIVDMHHGSIGFTSPGKGMGTTFFVELPIYVSEPSPINGNPTSSLPSSSTLSANENTLNFRASKYVTSSNDNGLQPSSVADINSVSASYRKKSPLRLSSSTFSGIAGLLSGLKVSPLLTEHDDLCPVRVITKPLRVLIVDDSDLNRKVLRRQIQSESSGIWQNAVVKEADDGLTALELMRTEMVAGECFDFVLLDFVMLHMHGPETAKSMRTSLGFEGIIFGITGNALPEDVRVFKESGVNDVLIKPLSKANLLAAFRAHVRTGDNAV
eukprot:CAMPEP_0201112880 /NCGR_PEP_ID=MMETSP0812-20130820/77514_1 /ASSEMBLY_ACC=CAM_ASM_000668 /TAXON_ID=98059 /ORGANISM="Dinobryon sp., Strain UTEXLB2267" /LENGTH=717 /DNA_ID=CAMNT_0047376309 /DNA_START=781 /DNA_END=2938 /DNA_ORIENTATION=-